jgi:RNA polymerase sigma factor (sigma-70 family)
LEEFLCRIPRVGGDILPNMSETDLQLLARYSRHRDQDAFGEIVRRHLDLVHSAALRQVRSPQLAEEVAQSVFMDLARQAHRLAPDTILTAWLYQVTRRTAVDVVRREARRQNRENLATQMNAMLADSGTEVPSAWLDIEPLLDEAMAALDDADRAAILLRYFENKNLREVGQSLGTSEDAAQKRVSRAVERLRNYLTKRGITVGASGLITAISANAVQAAPAGLAATISTAGLVGATLATTAAATSTQAIAMTTLQKTVVTAIVTVLAGTGIYQARQASQLREENRTLQQQHAPLVERVESLISERDQTAQQLSALRDENERLYRNTGELLRLRGEIGVLRRQLADHQIQAESRRSDNRETTGDAGFTLTPGALHDMGNSTPEAAIQTFLSAAMQSNRGRVVELLDDDSVRSAALVRIRQAAPDMGLHEAESIAGDAVDQLKQDLLAGELGFFIPDSVVAWHFENSEHQMAEAGGEVTETMVFRVGQVLQDGTRESGSLELTRVGDQWLITLRENMWSAMPAPEAPNGLYSDHPTFP